MKYGFKHVCIELFCVLIAVYLAMAGVAVGWHILNLRGGGIALWSVFVLLSALAPYFLAQIYFIPSPFNHWNPRCESGHNVGMNPRTLSPTRL